MTKSHTAFLGLGALMVVLGYCVSSEVSAQEFSAEGALANDDAFEVGGSCAALAYLSAAQLKAYISSGYSDDFHSFCFPEEPSDCTDYSGFLKGLGRLSTGEDGYHCSLQLQL
jgi:hypothetical protein